MSLNMTTILKPSVRCALLLLGAGLFLASTGCRSFLAGQAIKNYPVKIKPADALAATNRYQEDFLYLTTLADEVFPLEDRSFPPEKRRAMQQETLQKLGQPGCTHDEFVLSIESYLHEFNCEHAGIVLNPRPVRSDGFYPFRTHYVSNDLYVIDIAREYDRSLLGQKITAINDQPVSEVERKMFTLEGEENLWTRRHAVESDYSEPGSYFNLGLASSISNSVKLAFADHAPVLIAPKWKGNFARYGVSSNANPIIATAPHQYDCRIFPEQNLAYFQFNACFDKIAILDGLTMVKPWARPLVRAWLAFQFLREKPSPVLDGIYDPARPVFKDYLASVIRDINRQGITNLVLDMRLNGGGETELCKQLVYYLTSRTNLLDLREFEYNPRVFAYYDPKEAKEFHAWYVKKFGVEPPSKQLLPTPEQDKPFFAEEMDTHSLYYIAPDRPVFTGRIIVLANQNTGSAASHLAGLIQDNRLALIVGTPTGNNPTGPTGMTPYKLPHSGILISLPNVYVERAVPTNGDILQPDYWVENSVADLQAGRDAAFEKALDILHLDGAFPMTNIYAAVDFLRSVKRKGQLPGWSKKDKGAIYLESCSDSITFGILKQGDSTVYHYAVAAVPEDGSWKLQESWRTDARGRIIR
jgi:hypothetical protein